MLASNAMILQALLEGGWSQEKEDSEPEEVQRDDPDFEPSENALVQSILAGSGANDENETAVDVQSALNSQTVSRLIRIYLFPSKKAGRGCGPREIINI